MPHISRIMRAGMSISGDRGTVGNSKKRRLRGKHAMVSVTPDSTSVSPLAKTAVDRGTVGNSKKRRLTGKHGIVRVALDSTRIYPVVIVALDRGTVGNSKKRKLKKSTLCSVC
jgi:hypothetical protein